MLYSAREKQSSHPVVPFSLVRQLRHASAKYIVQALAA
jgi:hypothetical protein